MLKHGNKQATMSFIGCSLGTVSDRFMLTNISSITSTLAHILNTKALTLISSTRNLEMTASIFKMPTYHL